MTFEEHLRQHVLDQQFFQAHSRVLVALSGGKDSLYLVSFLYRHQEELGIQMGLAHVNYGQRPEAAWEEKSLERLAQDLEIPFYSCSFTGKFTELAARDFRYTFFKRLMVEEAYTALITAHHQDDQVETILMRIIQGKHLESLGGMKQCQSFGPGQLIRPLLPFAKQDLPQEFYFEDSSNSSPTYFRNRVRHQLLPLLRAENPGLDRGLLRLSQQVEDLYGLLASRIPPLDPSHLEKWQEEPEVLQIYLLDQYLKNYPQLHRGPNSLDSLARLLRKDGSHRTYLGQGYWLDKRYNSFEITSPPSSQEELPPFLLEVGQVTDFGAFRFFFERKPQGPILAEILVESKPVLLRRRQEGDAFEWNGYRRKLRRWFINEKIPVQEREQAVIVEQNEKIQGIVNSHGPCLSIENEHGIMKARIYVQKMKIE
ncbi:tRNA lysidine(34) synthetase TilS [Streptococcus danieliae]|uniref:tRNA lysidine(34) synthetase TilS n=1 Tax=Streptococcus danieliae TaxID=747656 RepID=UPI0021C99E76|nr:tRNA lysidine(34) synthetase TilS [Streptococcus danieliae]MCU0082451.1 tRNA lysidine(34) synthetase TilS [Streptococcus danieliae]